MVKYKTIILIEKIRKCLEEGNPQEALVIAESIDKKKLKNMSDLSVVAESYFQNVRYDVAKDLYTRIYHNTPSRRIVAQLVHLSIKLNDIEEANHYLKEFIRVAPKDFYQYIFRYSIDKLTKAPLVKLIEDLVDLKNAEHIESWAYELAKLYHKAGMKEECIAECDDIVLWFGSGEYVERAKALRAYYRGELKIDETSSQGHIEDEKLTSNVNIEDSMVDSEIESEKESEDIFEEESEEIFEQESEEIFEEESKEIFEIEPEEVFEEESKEIFEQESEEIFEEESKEIFEIEPEEVFEEESKEIFEIETEEVFEEESKEKFEEESEEIFEEKSKEALEGESEEKFDRDSNDHVEGHEWDVKTEIETIEKDDFLGLESALAEQLECTFQEAEALFKGEAEAEVLEDVVIPTSDTDIAASTLASNVPEDGELEKEVKAEMRRILKAKDFHELATSIDIIQEVSPIQDVAIKEADIAQDQTIANGRRQKKFNLKTLTNEQLVEEEEEDLLVQLVQNQVSLLEIFGNFMRMEVVRKQLTRSMDQILTQREKNIIITGESQSGKTKLAKDYAKLLQRMKLIQSTKVALIDGKKLNNMNLLAKKDQLKNCVIVIENASVISEETIKTLLELSSLYHNNIAMILEDTKEKMNRLLQGNSQLNSIFTNQVHLHKYTLDDYMGFAYDYIIDHDYEIEMEAFIELQNEFTVIMQMKRENTLQAIFSYLDEIILKSEKRSAEQLKELSQSGRFADTELMVVKREDIKS